MKMQMLGSLILCNSMMVGSGSQSEPIADDKKCSSGYDDWRYPSKFRQTCEGGCDRTACTKAQDARPEMDIKQCYTTAQLKEDGSLSKPGADPNGCNYGSEANTCALDSDGKCVYADWYPGSPLKPKPITISYKPKTEKAAGLAATSDSDAHEYRLILTDENDQLNGAQKLRLVAVGKDLKPLDPKYRSPIEYSKDKQVWLLGKGGVFNADGNLCLQLVPCSGGKFCLRVTSDQGTSCTTSNGIDKVWNFQQTSIRIRKSANLCMGEPSGGDKGMWFNHLHGASKSDRDSWSDCDDSWTSALVDEEQYHKNEPLLDSQTTLPATCESCKAEGDVKHFLCATAGGCVATPGESVCSTITGGTWCAASPSHEIVNPDSGKCLDIYNSEYKDQAKVQIFTCHGTDNQQWRLHDGALVNPVSGKCLGIYNHDGLSPEQYKDEMKAELFSCNGGTNQKWAFQDGLLVNTPSGKCLDIRAAKFDDETPVQLFHCKGKTDQSNQRWKMDHVVTLAGPTLV